MIPTPELEQQVRTAMKTLVEHYQGLDDLTDAMLAKQTRSEAIDEELKQLEQAKSALQLIEQETLPQRDAYRSAVDHASDEIQGLSQQATGLLERIIEKVNQMETATREAHQKLVPTINQSLRAHQMHQAYGKA